MGRSTARHYKRNKKAKSAKKVWKKKHAELLNLPVQRIFEDFSETEPVTRDEIVKEISEDIVQNKIISSSSLTKSLPGNDHNSYSSACKAADELLEVEELVKRNPQWCSRVYEAQFCNKVETSGIIESDEYEEIMNYPLNFESAPKESLGNRVVEIEYVLNMAMQLQFQHSKICPSGKLFVKNEKRRKLGLISTIIMNCTACPKIYECNTENLGNKASQINYGAVWGTLATGSSYNHLEELLACMNVPVMPDNMFYDIENELGKEWRLSLWRSFESAGIEERKYAIQNNQLCPDGTPWISVYVDGSWSKRSYGSNYNSASGMVGIIGQQTGELLFVAVRNRFCSICTRAENKNKEPLDHTCYKNWYESAPAMEPNMVVEGFCESERMHGVRYMEFVADGDASVFAKIKENVPYGSEVKKIECTNHVLKNYGKSLRKIKADTQIQLKGRKLLTQKKIFLLTKRAKCSIYEHAKSDGDVNLLREDLRNGLHHVFGDHLQCREVICNTVGDQTENKIPELKSTFMYHHLNGALQLVLRKAHLLIKNENNNRAERLMNIISRFNMGKRLNLVQRGSYQRRVVLSGLRHNKSFNWHLSPWKNALGKSPGTHFKNFIKKHTLKKETAAKRKLFLHSSDEIKTSNHKVVQANNKDYGKYADEPEEEEDTDFILMESQLQTQKLQVSVNEIKRIECESRGQFGNQTYENERQPRLTASLFGQAIKRRPHTPCHNLVKACLKPSNFYSAATDYGITKESVAIARFTEKTNLNVQKSGLWIDDEFGFLAASPDGIIGDDAIVEVKCIYIAPDSILNKTEYKNMEDIVNALKNRICLKNIGGIIQLKQNHSYYYQIQGQLNITKRKKCYLVVYVNDKIEIFIQEIYKDELFWKRDMLPKLTSFYSQCIAPERVRRCLDKNKQCVDPPHIKNAMQLYKEKQKNQKKEKEAKQAKKEENTKLVKNLETSASVE